MLTKDTVLLSLDVEAPFLYEPVIGFTFGILDRTYNLYIDDGYYNAIDLVQLFTVLFFILILLILYPFEFNKDE